MKPNENSPAIARLFRLGVESRLRRFVGVTTPGLEELEKQNRRQVPQERLLASFDQLLLSPILLLLIEISPVASQKSILSLKQLPPV